jgi:hypothetical protein
MNETLLDDFLWWSPVALILSVAVCAYVNWRRTLIHLSKAERQQFVGKEDEDMRW